MNSVPQQVYQNQVEIGKQQKIEKYDLEYNRKVEKSAAMAASEVYVPDIIGEINKPKEHMYWITDE